ncbi:MAG: alpha/beta fold hydrolase, partial [Myxococcales bacterium]|nr:alpha/beta fold hydrolase [Myxococcales bacterium]
MTTDVERLDFAGRNGQTLSGRLHLPAVSPIACAVFAHCFTCSKESRAARFVAAALAEKGIVTLRFDFAGLGESEGEFDSTTLAHDADDIVAAAGALRSLYRVPVLLVGHSLGGAAALAAAGQISEAAGVATIGAPFEAEHAEQISSMRRALVVFHSPQDNVVGIENARLIYETARHPKSFVSLDGADHLLGRRSDARYVADVLAAWAGRYLPERPAEEMPEDTPEGEVIVEGKT